MMYICVTHCSILYSWLVMILLVYRCDTLLLLWYDISWPSVVAAWYWFGWISRIDDPHVEFINSRSDTTTMARCMVIYKREYDKISDVKPLCTGKWIDVPNPTLAYDFYAANNCVVILCYNSLLIFHCSILLYFIYTTMQYLLHYHTFHHHALIRCNTITGDHMAMSREVACIILELTCHCDLPRVTIAFILSPLTLIQYSTKYQYNYYNHCTFYIHYYSSYLYFFISISINKSLTYCSLCCRSMNKTNNTHTHTHTHIHIHTRTHKYTLT